MKGAVTVDFRSENFSSGILLLRESEFLTSLYQMQLSP